MKRPHQIRRSIASNVPDGMGFRRTSSGFETRVMPILINTPPISLAIEMPDTVSPSEMLEGWKCSDVALPVQPLREGSSGGRGLATSH